MSHINHSSQAIMCKQRKQRTQRPKQFKHMALNVTTVVNNQRYTLLHKMSGS